jgi:hypothetical protein
VKLIIEPADGVGPLLAAIRSAKRSVEIAISASITRTSRTP